MDINNSRAYRRLKALTERLGFKLTEGSLINAEILAYSAGIERVKAQIEEAEREINIDTAKSSGLFLYSQLAGIFSRKSEAEKKSAVKKRFSQKYGDYFANDFSNALKAVNPETVCTINGFDAVVEVKNTAPPDYLKQLGRVIADYIPPFMNVDFGGIGCTFDYWDSTLLMFQEYDDFECPFSALDSLPEVNN